MVVVVLFGWFCAGVAMIILSGQPTGTTIGSCVASGLQKRQAEPLFMQQSYTCHLMFDLREQGSC